MRRVALPIVTTLTACTVYPTPDQLAVPAQSHAAGPTGFHVQIRHARRLDSSGQVCANNREADGAAAMRALLTLAPRPTAVLCLTDRLALGALAARQQAGLSVPGAVSLVGFDDIPSAAQSAPPLTTIRQEHRKKGLLAGQALLALLRGEEVEQAAPLPVQLVARGTTGPAPED